MSECKVDLWYPQMGGYAAKAQVTFEYVTHSNVSEPGCFNAQVYHDGVFPLGKRDKNYKDLLNTLLENVTEWHYEIRDGTQIPATAVGRPAAPRSSTTLTVI